MPRGARSNYERTRSVPQHPDMAPAKRLRLLGRRATNVQTRPPLLIAAQTSRRAALRALQRVGRRKQRQRPRTPVLRKVKGAAGAITTGAGDGLRRAPQDRPRTPALAGLAFAAFRPGTDTARESRWALVR